VILQPEGFLELGIHFVFDLAEEHAPGNRAGNLAPDLESPVEVLHASRWTLVQG
jgi:hypothetical protein